MNVIIPEKCCDCKFFRTTSIDAYIYQCVLYNKLFNLALPNDEFKLGFCKVKELVDKDEIVNNICTYINEYAGEPKYLIMDIKKRFGV